MSAEDSVEATVAPVETVPEQGTLEQTKPQSLQDMLLGVAKDEGYTVQGEPPAEPVKETPEVEPVHEPIPEPEPEEELGEPEPVAAEDKLVPLRDVVEERAKKRRANERAEKAEAEMVQARNRIMELERALVQAAAPKPNRNEPVVDIQDLGILEGFTSEYREIIATDPREAVNEDGTIRCPAGRDANGQRKYQNLEREDFELVQKRAQNALLLDIPERRKFLADRAIADNEAVKRYPDLTKPDSDFAKTAGYLAYQIVSGRARNEPDLLQWVARAVRGYQLEQKAIGTGPSGVSRIVESSQTKLAPSAPRTRGIVERKAGADTAKAERELEQRGDQESALAYLTALRTPRPSGARSVGRVSG